jgi:hypothetical protein
VECPSISISLYTRIVRFDSLLLHVLHPAQRPSPIGLCEAYLVLLIDLYSSSLLLLALQLHVPCPLISVGLISTREEAGWNTGVTPLPNPSHLHAVTGHWQCLPGTPLSQHDSTPYERPIRSRQRHVVGHLDASLIRLSNDQVDGCLLLRILNSFKTRIAQCLL